MSARFADAILHGGAVAVVMPKTASAEAIAIRGNKMKFYKMTENRATRIIRCYST